MKEQTIRRMRDAIPSQGRIILTMSCGHYQHMSELEYRMLRVVPMEGERWICQACPDPPKVREKTAVELWKEAGEP